VNRRCSYLTGDDNGTSLGYGTAVAQDDRYVTVVPDGDGELLRLPVAYVDFHPLADPHHFDPAATRPTGQPQRTWISLVAPTLSYVRTEDGTTVAKDWIAKLIGQLDWQPATASVDDSIQGAIEQFHLADVRQVAKTPGLEAFKLRFDGIETRCPHGRVRLYLFDHGSGPMVVCRDVWFDAGDTANEER